jgi:putative transposase
MQRQGPGWWVEVIMDGGPENVNQRVDRFTQLLAPALRRRVALRDIQCSNSMVEAVNKRLKYGFLYRDPPADGAALRRQVDAAFAEENAQRPLHALQGRTPDEAYNGLPNPAPGLAAHAAQVALRRVHNAARACAECR